jgi:hypothetical protein
MKTTLHTLAFATFMTWAGTAAQADCVTGTINTINAWESSGTVMIQMSNRATLQGTCPAPSQWFAQAFTDSNFRQFLYPVILEAKAAQDSITICASGCLSSTYPLIDSVEYSPRLP